MDIRKNLKEKKYFCDEKVTKILNLFEVAGRRNRSNISSIILTGPAGGGKTCLAEHFASIVKADLMFLQCFPGMGVENLMTTPNIPAILKRDSEHAINEGILIKALENTKEKPTVLVLDEIDKTTTEVDSFLLDFLNSGRITNGQQQWIKGNQPIWVFITSNGERDISDALINRCRQLHIERPSKDNFLKALNLNEKEDKFGMAIIYDSFPNFSIRQAKEYLLDLNELNVNFDLDLLSQYVDLNSHKEVNSLAELEMFGLSKETSIDYPAIEVNIHDKDFLDYMEKNKESIILETDSNENYFLKLTTINMCIDVFQLFHDYYYFNGTVEINKANIKKSFISTNKYNPLRRYGLYYLDDDFVVEGFEYEGKNYCKFSSSYLKKYLIKKGELIEDED
ncbi:TPA: AAA family ATPase [Clostridium botulinum]|nr:AAA family ATPase [Clostridium botulinum]